MTFKFGFFALAVAGALSAAPRLALTPQTAYTVSVAQGSNGSTISVDAGNRGDGALNLSVSASVPWLAPALGTPHSCGFGQCTPVQIALQTSTLAKGIYTGFVTVSDPNAIDAPQTISVTAQIGGGVPDQLTFYVAPGSSMTQSIATTGLSNIAPSTQTGGNWLSVAVNGNGSFAFNASVPYNVTATAGTSMAAGDYQGSLAVTGSSFAPDNKTVGVTLHVTTQPIAQINPSAVSFRIAQGAAKQTANIGVSNAGQGTLTVTSATAATTSGSTWLTAQTIQGGVSITADPGSLAPGPYQGTVTVASNAANSSIAIPVTLNVVTQGRPISAAGGVVNNGNFAPSESLAQGDIVALFGDQLTTGDPQQAASLPLSTNLGGTQVLLNGQLVPVYYVAAGQIDFQVPYDAAIGDGTVSVNRNGQSGNQVRVNIAASVPRLLVINAGPYAIVATPAGALTGIPGAPAHVGDTFIIYAIGLGPTTPSVPSGAGSPVSPLATIPGATQVCFGAGGLFGASQCTNVLFAGLTPNFVGLYQINVTVPQGVPTGPNVPMYVQIPGGVTNTVQLAIQ